MNALLGTVVIISSVLVGSNANRDGWMINERDTFKRDDPDAILNGFFPFWGALVLALSCFFLVVAALGLVGYLLGCRSTSQQHHHHESTAPLTLYIS